MSTYFESRLTDIEAELGEYTGEIASTDCCKTCDDNALAEIRVELRASEPLKVLRWNSGAFEIAVYGKTEDICWHELNKLLHGDCRTWAAEFTFDHWAKNAKQSIRGHIHNFGKDRHCPCGASLQVELNRAVEAQQIHAVLTI